MVFGIQAYRIGRVTSTVVLATLICACNKGGAGGGPSAPVTIQGLNGGSITVVSSAGTVTGNGIAPPVGAPGNFAYGQGFYSYQISGLSPGAKVTVTVTTPSGTAPTAYLKCSSAGTQCAPFDKATINGNQIQLTLQDGGFGDADGVANGVIADPGAPAFAASNPAPPAYYLPYYDFNASDLFVVPSSALSTAPAHIAAGSVQSSIPEIAQTLYNSSGQAYAEVPYTILYIPQNNHLYRLDLQSVQTPQQIQVSSFSGISDNCFTPFFIDRQNLADPASTFVILFCDALLVHLADSPTTAPQQLPIRGGFGENGNQGPAAAFHDAQGMLNGILALDNSGNLNLYADTSFSNPQTLLSSVTSFGVIYATSSYAFINATTQPFGSNSQPSTMLYRVDSAGHISPALYTYLGNNGFHFALPDPSNTLLIITDDTYTGNTAYTVTVAELPLTGAGTASTIYSASGTLNLAGGDETFLIPYGFIGSQLIFSVDSRTSNGNTFTRATSLYSVSVAGAAPFVATKIAGISSGYFAAETIAGSKLFTNVVSLNSNGQATGVSAEVLGADGSLVKQYTSSEFLGSVFQPGGTILSPAGYVSSLVLAKGYTATGNFGSLPNLGGAAVESVSALNLTETPVTKNGANFIFGSGESFAVRNTGAPVSGVSDNAQIGQSSTETSNAAAFIVDSLQFVQITSGTNDVSSLAR